MRPCRSAKVARWWVAERGRVVWALIRFRSIEIWEDLECGRTHGEQRYADAWRLIASDVFPPLASPPPREHPRTGNSPKVSHQRAPQADTTVFLVDDDAVEGQCRIEMTNRDGAGWSFYFPVEHLIPGQYGRGLYNNVVEGERQRLFVGVIRQEVDHDTGGDTICLTPGQILQHARGFGSSECHEVKRDLLYYEKQGMPSAQRDDYIGNQKRLSELGCSVESAKSLPEFNPGIELPDGYGSLVKATGRERAEAALADAGYSAYVPLKRAAQPNISIGLFDDEAGAVQDRDGILAWRGEFLHVPGDTTLLGPGRAADPGSVRPGVGSAVVFCHTVWTWGRGRA